jgi:hypothetical protein
MEPQRPQVVPTEPVPEPIDVASADPLRRTRALARIRVPLTLTVQPWATLYRTPDGRRWWCIRLPEAGTVRTHCVSTERLRAYARMNRLAEMEHAIDEALAAKGSPDAADG